MTETSPDSGTAQGARPVPPAAAPVVAPRGRNLTVFFACLAFVGGVVGMSFAAAPLYSMYCQLTGYNGTTQRADAPSTKVLDRKVTVTFDANVSTGLNWDFKPDQPSVRPRIGETIEARYTVTNRSPYPTKGQAVFNVTPMEAAVYFNKIQCFCFTETVLQPGQTLDMPVVFYVDPEINDHPETKNIGTITLSYTFYPHEGTKPVAELPAARVETPPKL